MPDEVKKKLVVGVLGTPENVSTRELLAALDTGGMLIKKPWPFGRPAVLKTGVVSKAGSADAATGAQTLADGGSCPQSEPSASWSALGLMADTDNANEVTQCTS